MPTRTTNRTKTSTTTTTTTTVAAAAATMSATALTTAQCRHVVARMRHTEVIAADSGRTGKPVSALPALESRTFYPQRVSR